MLTKVESILLWSSNIWGFGTGMLGPLYAVFAQKVGGDILELSWAYACYLVTMGLGVVVVGRIADKRNDAKVLLVVGAAVGSVAAFSYLLVSSMWGLLVVQILSGVSTALREPSWYSLYDRYSGEGNNDGVVWGLAAGLWYVCQGIALMAGAYLVYAYSFDVLFIVMGTILAISTLYQATILRYS